MDRDTKAMAEDEFAEATVVPPETTTGAVADKSNKRKHREPAIQESAYFKMMVLLQQLRPYFIEVLQAPDFRNCKASYQIRKKMKVFMDLYKQTQIEGNTMRNAEDKLHSQPSPTEKKARKEECGEAFVCIPQSEDQNLEDIRPKGSYILGGSVTGKNFIMFVNRKSPEYYGVTKELHRRASDEKLQKGILQLETVDPPQEKKTTP